MHSGIAAAAAVVVSVTGATLGNPGRRVLLLLLLSLSLSRVTAVREGDGMLDVGLGAVHPRLVNADF